MSTKGIKTSFHIGTDVCILTLVCIKSNTNYVQLILAISLILIFDRTSYSLRQTDFSIPRCNTVTYGQHSLCYLGPKLPKKYEIYKNFNNFKKVPLESLTLALSWMTDMHVCVVLAAHLCS